MGFWSPSSAVTLDSAEDRRCFSDASSRRGRLGTENANAGVNRVGHRPRLVGRDQAEPGARLRSGIFCVYDGANRLVKI